MPLPLLAGAIGKGLLGAKASKQPRFKPGEGITDSSIRHAQATKDFYENTFPTVAGGVAAQERLNQRKPKPVVNVTKFVGSKKSNVASRLKENATNLRDFLERQNKNQDKIRTKKQQRKKRAESINKKREKEKELESQKSSSDQKKTEKNLAKSPLDILNKIFSLGGLLLGGILVNAFEGIKKKAEEFYNNNKELFDTIGNFLSGVKDAAVGLFDSFTGPYSEEGAFDDFAKFDDNGKLQSGALKKVEDAYNGFGDLINTIDKALGGKGTAGNFIKTDTTSSTPMPSREELVNQTERGSGMASFREDATENAELQKSVRDDGRKDIPVSPGGSFSEGALISALDAAGYTNKKERAMFLAQMAHETGNFRYDEEIHDGSNYEGRSDLGNNQPGDGKRYKGRGYIQLTGRANYRQYGNLIGVDLENNPDLAKDPNIAARVAIEYWKKRVDRTAAKNGDVRTVTYNINGGYNGLADRMQKYKKYLKKSKPQPKITPVPDKGNQARVINQPDPTDEEVATLFIQRVNTIQYIPVPS